jgi:ribosomal protein L12E/L44/L45/RPP1/RPP2
MPLALMRDFVTRPHISPSSAFSPNLTHLRGSKGESAKKNTGEEKEEEEGEEEEEEDEAEGDF